MKPAYSSLQFLIKRAESIAVRKQRRDVRPDWLRDLTDDLAELFTPLSGVARVGFESELADDRWAVSVYLGKTEQIGGPDDGTHQMTNFRFDIRRMLKLFTTVDEFNWTVLPQTEIDLESTSLSMLVIDGDYDGEPVTVRIQSAPPEETGIGLLVHQDGRVEAPEV